MKRFTLTFLSIWMTCTLIAQPSFTEQTVDASFSVVEEIYAIDMDNDGDIDVLGAAPSDNEIAWWENDGSQSFTKHTVDANFTFANRVYAIDIDGDNDIDILGSAYIDDEIAWWENDGNQNFTKHTIDNNFDAPISISAVDMDEDGDLDVLSGAFNAGEIAWWENNGSQSFTKNTISSSIGVSDTYPIDVDGDEDIDVVIADYSSGEVSWMKNDGTENFTKEVAGSINFSSEVYSTDIDDDGDIDILGVSNGADEIAWWKNDGTENFTKHILNGSFDGANSVYATDLDGDGDIDILGAAYNDNDILWWENDGAGNFTEQDIDINFTKPTDVFAIDMDNDGDMDLLVSAVNSNDITWWENDLINQTLDFDGTDDYVTIGDIDAIDNILQLTAAGWFYFDGVANGLRLISKQTAGGSDAGWHIALGGTNTGGSDDIKFTHNFDGSSSGSIYTDGLGLTTGHWYHIAVVYDGTQATASNRITIYINGKVQTNNVYGSDVPTTLPVTMETLVLGAKSDGSGNFFQGNMDEVSIWRTAFSQSDIREMMHVMVSDTTNLEAYYRFHVAAGTPTFGDDSGKRHTGTWNGASNGTNTTSTLETQTQPFTTSNIDNVSGVWSGTSTDGTNFSDGFRISAGTALTGTNRAVCGHDNPGTTITTDDLTSSTAIERFEQIWKIEKEGTVTDATLQFDLGTITGSAITAGTASDYVLLYRAGTSGDFSDIATGNAISNTDRVKFTTISLLNGYYTIGTISVLLPVELLNFTGHKVTEGVQLHWQTATELNNSHFEVEWSRDGFSFTKIGTVQGAGTTNEIQEYGFLHELNRIGLNYYRLRQVDIDGNTDSYRYEYSKTIQINYELSTDNTPLAIYPNPAKDFITIKNVGIGETIQIFNIRGQLVLETQFQLTPIPINQLLDGTYFIKTGNTIKKLIISK